MANTKVQSIIFKKRFWTIPRAIKWLNNHGFKYIKVDEKENYYRFRQFPPKKSYKYITKENPKYKSIKFIIVTN